MFLNIVSQWQLLIVASGRCPAFEVQPVPENRQRASFMSVGGAKPGFLKGKRGNGCAWKSSFSVGQFPDRWEYAGNMLENLCICFCLSACCALVPSCSLYWYPYFRTYHRVLLVLVKSTGRKPNTVLLPKGCVHVGVWKRGNMWILIGTILASFDKGFWNLLANGP